MLSLNLGSGQRPFKKPFVNVDINPRWRPDIVANCSSMPMIEDASAEIVVMHHCAEHMTLGQSQAAFTEAWRTLVPGGSLLVFVPDLHALTHAWIQGRITDYIFCVNLHGAYMNDEADIHRWSYTAKTLTEHLYKAANWRGVVPFNWRTIPGADISRDWWILGLEAVK